MAAYRPSLLCPLLLALTALLPLGIDLPVAAQPAGPEQDGSEALTLATATTAEKDTLRSLRESASWTKRAVAAVRLERFRCDVSGKMLMEMLDDPIWQVRCFAVQSLARRRIPAGADWFADEQEPRVLRAALRHRYAIDPQRLDRGVRYLARSDRLEDKMLAAEIGAAARDEELQEVAREAAKKVILRMRRAEVGLFSPRLAVVTGHRDLRRASRWQRWAIREGRSFVPQPGYAIDEGGDPPAPPLIAQLDSERFAALEDYMEKLSAREVDVAICLDCTASMSGELAAAQAGIDDLMLFVGDVVGSLRVGLVAYRDRRDREFETKGWDFTADPAEVRQRLWQLSAQGGGDRREAVYNALSLAYAQMSWGADRTKILILIGDAPPHVGFGKPCADMARRGAEIGLTTHVIQAEGEDVEHFAQIAEAGEGRVVSLEDDSLLIPEIAGLTLGDVFLHEFGEFFEMYLRLCR